MRIYNGQAVNSVKTGDIHLLETDNGLIAKTEEQLQQELYTFAEAYEQMCKESMNEMIEVYQSEEDPEYISSFKLQSE